MTSIDAKGIELFFLPFGVMLVIALAVTWGSMARGAWRAGRPKVHGQAPPARVPRTTVKPMSRPMSLTRRRRRRRPAPEPSTIRHPQRMSTSLVGPAPAPGAYLQRLAKEQRDDLWGPTDESTDEWFDVADESSDGPVERGPAVVLGPSPSGIVPHHLRPPLVVGSVAVMLVLLGLVIENLAPKPVCRAEWVEGVEGPYLLGRCSPPPPAWYDANWVRTVFWVAVMVGLIVAMRVKAKRDRIADQEMPMEVGPPVL